MLQALGPVLRFENTKEGDDCLTGCIPDHGGIVTKSVKNSSLDIVRDLRRSAGDESGIVLEEIAGNRPDTILLLWEGTKDVDKIGDVLWCTGKVVKFLPFRLHEIS